MGGRLRVQSTPGTGSRFDFELDLPATAVENDLPKRLSRILSPGRPVRAMVIDDVTDSRRVVADLLRRIGCDVTEASSAAEAVEIVDAARPEIAVVDIMMPGVDGIATATLLRGERAATSSCWRCRRRRRPNIAPDATRPDFTALLPNRSNWTDSR